MANAIVSTQRNIQHRSEVIICTCTFEIINVCMYLCINFTLYSYDAHLLCITALRPLSAMILKCSTRGHVSPRAPTCESTQWDHVKTSTFVSPLRPCIFYAFQLVLMRAVRCGWTLYDTIFVFIATMDLLQQFQFKFI